MKFLFIIATFIGLALVEAQLTCDESCKRENNCACASSESPLPFVDTTQFVTFSFHDVLTTEFPTNYFDNLFGGRKNPDKKPMTATFYVGHLDTDYPVVNDMFNKGHEISLNSVTNGTDSYWKTATQEQIKQEFDDNRKMLQRYSNITSTRIIGARIPNLQLPGDEAFNAYNELELQYDASCLLDNFDALFPFTLDFTTDHNCNIGKLPKGSFPGIWSMPIMNLIGIDNVECHLPDCKTREPAIDIKRWFEKQFIRFYHYNRVPITFMISSEWFLRNPNTFEGVQLFVDYLQTYQDVYVVSHQEVLQWSANPVPVSSYKTNYRANSRLCSPQECHLDFEGQERLLRVCGKCPKVYPWLGNPLGNP